jgi:hypothetical protein
MHAIALHIQARNSLELKTRPKFCPVNLSLSMATKLFLFFLVKNVEFCLKAILSFGIFTVRTKVKEPCFARKPLLLDLGFY